ncbi:MAG: ferrous iron transport protein B [Candidatus Methanofastidiosia archaeon]
MIVAMAGQPNSGKSTLFNYVAGYRAETSNYPGTLVRYLKSKVNLSGETFTLVDLPGTYFLISSELAELEARKYLLSGEVDVVVNVVDASLLIRGLEFTIQLLELEIPLVLCLNMMDEATRKGIVIDTEKLSEILKIPVVETVGVKGEDVYELFEKALEAEKFDLGRKPRFSKDVEDIIEYLSDKLLKLSEELKVPKRLLSKKLLENDDYFLKMIKDEAILNEVSKSQKALSEMHERPSDVVISSERHALSMNIFEEVARVEKAEISLRDRFDNILMHNLYGYLALLVILYTFFNIVFTLGGFLEGEILSLFERDLIPTYFKGLSYHFVSGLLEGVAGGVGIVLPYIVPFLIGLAILEDVGYLSRVAYLLDTFLHRLGLHGNAIIPIILGYGCTVPAIMGTRILESERDRFITATLTTLIPCAARTTKILGLVAFFISPNAALGVYALNLFVIGIAGALLSKMLPEVTSGLVLEIPSYKLPSLRVVILKTRLRTREFIYIAWTLLIAGSIVLSILSYYGIDHYYININQALSPLTLLLGLPAVVGSTLIFGILRKELSMIMLIQALRTPFVLDVMTKTQVLTFTIFVIFYIPCVATIGALLREIGKKKTLFVIFFTTGIAIILALSVRIFGGLL